MERYLNKNKKIYGIKTDFLVYSSRTSCLSILKGMQQDIPFGYMIKKGMIAMKKYVCEPCGYEYDPEAGDPDNGIAAGTAFEDLPEDWVCPVCGMGKDAFVEA